MSNPNLKTVITKNLFNEFREALRAVELTQSDIDAIIIMDVFRHRPEFMKILVVDFPNAIVNYYNNTNHYDYLSHIGLTKIVIEILGDKFLGQLNGADLCNIFFWEYQLGNHEIISKIFNFGFNVNNIACYQKWEIIIPNRPISEKFTEKYIDMLELMLENGFELNFINGYLLSRLFNVQYKDILKLLIKHGLDISNILNKMQIPKEFDDQYNLLINSNADPKKIAYMLSIYST